MSENIKLNAWEAAEEIVNLRRENAALQSKLKLNEFDAVGKQTMLQRLIDDLQQTVEHWKREATEAQKRSAFVASENTALRAAISESEEFARKNGETCGLKIRDLLRENAALNETTKKHVAAYYELLEKVRRLEQDLSITRQRRCHDIVESEKEDV